jgi:purine-binding chemotaxis protein CheW
MEKNSQSYLFFNVQDIKLGIHILSVREIISPDGLELNPKAPPPFWGEVNLRSTQMPVLGLQKILGTAPSDVTAKSRILIMEKDLNWFGLLVDNVLEMIKLDISSLFSLPQKYTDLNLSVFLGMGMVRQELFYLLNPDNITSLAELNQYYRLKVKPKGNTVLH